MLRRAALSRLQVGRARPVACAAARVAGPRWRRAGAPVACRFLSQQLVVEEAKEPGFLVPPVVPPKESGLGHSETIVVYALAGNLVIASAKAVCAVTSGSSAMGAEAVHSTIDAANQMLLLVGLRWANKQPDRIHQYGYGKSVYVWFWLGSGVALNASISELLVSEPSVDLEAIGRWDVRGVLAASLLIDGAVLFKSMRHVASTKPPERSLLAHIVALRDPTLLAVLLEDSAACVGVVIASAGLAAAHSTGIHALDAASGVAVGCLLGAVGASLAVMNGRFLIGHSVERPIVDGIEALLRSRLSIDHVHSVKSQWIAPDAFSYKCEVDFDGTWIAAQLYQNYEPRFATAVGDELPTLLSFFAEDVMRTVETEVRDVETLIRAHYPQATYIEIEPDARAVDREKGWALSNQGDREKCRLEKLELDSFIAEAARRAEKLRRHNLKNAPRAASVAVQGAADDKDKPHDATSSTSEPATSPNDPGAAPGLPPTRRPRGHSDDT